MLVHVQLESREREIIQVLTLSPVPGISGYAGTDPDLMEGTCEGSRHIAEGKEQVLKLKQSLTHQLDCLALSVFSMFSGGFVPSIHCLGKAPPGYLWGHQEKSLYQLVRCHSAI